MLILYILSLNRALSFSMSTNVDEVRELKYLESQTILEKELVYTNIYIRSLFDPKLFLGVDSNGYLEAIEGKPFGGNIKLSKSENGYYLYSENTQICVLNDYKLGVCNGKNALTDEFRFFKNKNGYNIRNGGSPTYPLQCLTFTHENTSGDLHENHLSLLRCDSSEEQLFDIARNVVLIKKDDDIIPDDFKELLFEVAESHH